MANGKSSQVQFKWQRPFTGIYRVGAGLQFSTIQSAINQAVADGYSNINPALIEIYPGVYPENLTFQPGINLLGMNSTPIPISIVGHHTYSGNGNLGCSNILFNYANAASTLLNLTPTGVSFVTFQNCVFNTNAILITAPAIIINSATSYFNFHNCNFLAIVGLSAGHSFFNIVNAQEVSIEGEQNNLVAGFIFNNLNDGTPVINTGGGTAQIRLSNFTAACNGANAVFDIIQTGYTINTFGLDILINNTMHHFLGAGTVNEVDCKIQTNGYIAQDNGGKIDLKTSLLLHLDNNPTDSSQYANVNNGDVAPVYLNNDGAWTFSRDFSPPTASLSFPSGLAGGIFDFQNQSFTIEARIKWDGNACVFLNRYNSLAPNIGDWYCEITAAGAIYFFVNGGFSISGINGSIANDGLFHHVAIMRNNDFATSYITVDGVLASSSTNIPSGFVYPFTPTIDFSLSKSLAGGNPRFSGQMDEVRISKGIARWPLNQIPFTPPTAPYTVFSSNGNYNYAGNVYPAYANVDTTLSYVQLNTALTGVY